MKNTVVFGDHKLTYDFNAICLLESEVGPVDAAIRAMEANPSFLTIRAIVWAGLHRSDHTIDINRAGEIVQEMMNGQTFKEIFIKVMDAVDNAFPDDEADGELGNSAGAAAG